MNFQFSLAHLLYLLVCWVVLFSKSTKQFSSLWKTKVTHQKAFDFLFPIVAPNIERKENKSCKNHGCTRLENIWIRCD